ncbi:TPA: LL-diaminopimelate aminotransferase [candidate division WOR-3 bacterium]|jgi:LL-diaminopimelate aminotransferase|uniref:Aminotransferase n=1 Tax=candidate division WOR-3 bacterium TaxID=2052148 RepID=A0A350HC36_UNCW3|nr:LL-diaminopimelate aminotransferase [candidate division WOR-3 bacterium]
MVSKKIKLIPPYIFNEIDKLKKSIKDPIDFGVGDPDMPTPSFIVKEMEQQIKIAENHKYPSYEGLPELREEIAKYFKKRFNVNLDPDNEILILIGSKEGIAHSLEAFLDKNDEVLLPSICYPVYRTQTLLKGGRVVEFPVNYENYFVPYFSDIKKRLSEKSKVLFLNYPNNPTGATVEKPFYDQAVDFAMRNNLIIMNDNVYCDVYFSKVRPPSIMQTNHAKDCAIEFHSFSKTFNMTGWRIGYAVGNRELIKALKQIKMNTDSGVFLPIQKAVIAGLRNIDNHVMQNNMLVKKRIDLLSEALISKGFEFHRPKASFYIFAKTLKKMKSAEFTKLLMKECGIITTPGIGFGEKGDDFIRFSLTLNDKDLKEGIRRIKKLKV